MQKKMTERLNVGVMMAGQGAMKDVFSETYRFLKDRKRREEALSMDMTKKAYSPAQEQARRYLLNLGPCYINSLFVYYYILLMYLLI